MFSDRDISVPKFNGHFLLGGFAQVSRDWQDERNGESLPNLGTQVSPDFSFCPSYPTKSYGLPAVYSCLFKYCSELMNQLAVIEIFPDLLARSGDDAVTQILIK